jgi:hypothetical protein
MNERKLKDWIDGFMQFTHHSEPPDSFRYWTAISCIAAALQRKVQISWGHIKWFPNMYIVLVGPSASRKGTAMGPGYDILNELGIPMAAQATTRQALIKRLTGSTCSEQIGTTMEFHSSMTIFSKEFTVFLGYHNRELMSDLCDWYDCDNRWKYETISRQTEEIIGVWVNLFGATTPELIAAALPADAIGSGLTSRIIFICEDSKGKVVPVHFLSQSELQLKQDLIADLEQINLMKGKFKFTEGFIDKWTDWYVREGALENKFNDPRFAGYTGRRATHVMKLCMIVSASRSNDMVISEFDLDRAIWTLEWAEKKMQKVFTGVGKSQIAETMPQIYSFIARKKETTLEELLQTFYYDTDEHEIKRIIRTLELSNAISVSGKKILYKDDVFYKQRASGELSNLAFDGNEKKEEGE